MNCLCGRIVFPEPCGRWFPRELSSIIGESAREFGKEFPEAAGALIAEMRALREALAAERAARAAAEEDNRRLRAEIADLKARLGADATNSSRPPSSDGSATTTRSLCRRTGRKPGGQPGRGSALQAAPAAGAEARQVFDLPQEIRLEVVGHRIESVACPRCGTVTKADAPPEASRQVQYGPRVAALLVYLVSCHHLPLKRTVEAFAAILGAPISPATVLKGAARAAQAVRDRFAPAAKATPAANADQANSRLLSATARAGRPDPDPHPASKHAKRHAALARRLKDRTYNYLYFATPTGQPAAPSRPTTPPTGKYGRSKSTRKPPAACEPEKKLPAIARHPLPDSHRRPTRRSSPPSPRLPHQPKPMATRHTLNSCRRDGRAGTGG
jgi:transposase